MAISACGPKAEPVAKKAEYTGPAAGRKSTSKERTDLGLTIYNGNFGLVRETRTLELGTGKVELEFQDVSANIQPETVHIKSNAPPGSLMVMEQNFRYDLLSPEK